MSAGKKKFQVRFVLVLLGGIAGSAAYADCPAGYFCKAPIQDMTMTDSAVYIRLVGGTTGLTNCTPYSSSYFTLPRTNNPNFAGYYATLLAAYMGKESVTIRPVDGSTGCTVSYIALP
jgi:hypothetical protein